MAIPIPTGAGAMRMMISLPGETVCHVHVQNYVSEKKADTACL